VREYRPLQLPRLSPAPDAVKPRFRRVVGVDIFVESAMTAKELGTSLEDIAFDSSLRLKMISNRGCKVYPTIDALTDCVDHWRCRFVPRSDQVELSDEHIGRLLLQIGGKHHWMHVEKLMEFDGQAGFTKAQGED
jgi:isocitrate dehydrogenase